MRPLAFLLRNSHYTNVDTHQVWRKRLQVLRDSLVIHNAGGANQSEGELFLLIFKRVFIFKRVLFVLKSFF